MEWVNLKALIRKLSRLSWFFSDESIFLVFDALVAADTFTMIFFTPEV